MNILGINVSENASRHIKKLCDEFKKPVEYHNIEENQDEKGPGGLAIDVTNPERYAVYLSIGLEQRVFESNVLYELLHIRQYETGFPTLCNKSSQLYYADREFVEGIGGSIFSGVLDAEVYDRLRECGYSDTVDWFTLNVYNGLLSAASRKYDNLDDKYSFANLAITFSRVMYHTNEEQDSKIQETFSAYPLVLARSTEIRDAMRRNHPDAPATAAMAMGKMIDALDLWDLFYILISGKKIRTRCFPVLLKPSLAGRQKY